MPDQLNLDNFLHLNRKRICFAFMLLLMNFMYIFSICHFLCNSFAILLVIKSDIIKQSFRGLWEIMYFAHWQKIIMQLNCYWTSTSSETSVLNSTTHNNSSLCLKILRRPGSFSHFVLSFIFGALLWMLKCCNIPTLSAINRHVIS